MLASAGTVRPVSNYSSTKNLSLSLIFLAGLAACGGADKEPAADADASCNEQPSLCGDGTVCEQLGDSKYMCLAPVLVRGHVFDASSATGVEGATIVAAARNGHSDDREIIAVSASS